MTQLIVDDEIMTILYTGNEFEAKHNPDYKKLEIMHTYNKNGMQCERILNIWTPHPKKFVHLINYWNNLSKLDKMGFNHHYTILEN